MARNRNYLIYRRAIRNHKKKVIDCRVYVTNNHNICADDKDLAKIFNEKNADAFLKQNTNHDWRLELINTKKNESLGT